MFVPKYKWNLCKNVDGVSSGFARVLICTLEPHKNLLDHLKHFLFIFFDTCIINEEGRQGVQDVPTTIVYWQVREEENLSERVLQFKIPPLDAARSS